MSVAGFSMFRVAIGVLGAVVPGPVLFCPCTFTGVAPKVALGVTLGLHEICRLELLGLIVAVLVALAVGAGGADRFGPQLIIFDWLLVVGPCDLPVELLAVFDVIDLVVRLFVSVKPKNSNSSTSSSVSSLVSSFVYSSVSLFVYSSVSSSSHTYSDQ